MRELKFIVDKQKIQQDPSCDFTEIVRDTKDYLKATFQFSDDWDGFVKVAEFYALQPAAKVIPVPIKNNGCNVPNDVTNTPGWKVRIIGKKQTTKLTTRICRVIQERR